MNNTPILFVEKNPLLQTVYAATILKEEMWRIFYFLSNFESPISIFHFSLGFIYSEYIFALCPLLSFIF